jgi:cell division protein FtsL
MRQMAYYGNLALRPERVQEEKAQTRTQTQPYRSKVARRRPMITIGEKLLYLFAIAVIVGVAGFIIFRYAQIYQINGSIQATSKVSEQVNEQSKELQREVERLSSSQEIMDKAHALGMVDLPKGINVTSQIDQNAVAMNQP